MALCRSPACMRRSQHHSAMAPAMGDFGRGGVGGLLAHIAGSGGGALLHRSMDPPTAALDLTWRVVLVLVLVVLLLSRCGHDAVSSLAAPVCLSVTHSPSSTPPSLPAPSTAGGCLPAPSIHPSTIYPHPLTDLPHRRGCIRAWRQRLCCCSFALALIITILRPVGPFRRLASDLPT